MTDHRLKAAWLRTFAGLFAFLGLLVLGGCGGGSGAPNPTFTPITTLELLPGDANVYPNTPTTFRVNGGRGPYSVFSSDQSAVPVPASFNGTSFTVIPMTVSAETTVTLTVRDAEGNTSNSELTLRPAPLVASLTLKADGFAPNCPNPGGSSSAVDANGQTFICAGQTGSVAVKVANAVGGGIAGRQIRFDVVQGDFQLFTNAPGQPPTYALSYTVPTDQNGDAIARVRALPNAPQQVVIVQATDLLTGTFVRGIFVIINGAGQEITVVPDEFVITGPDTETCSSGATVSFFIFGGAPPYTISNTVPGGLIIEPTIVTASGAGFNATTTGACLDSVDIAITDANGHTTTVEITNEPGTATPPEPEPIVIFPETIPALACGASQTVVVGGGGTTGNPAGSFNVAVDRPDVVNAMVSGSNPFSVALTRITPNSITPPANVLLIVSDNLGQIATATIPIATPAPCP